MPETERRPEQVDVSPARRATTMSARLRGLWAGVPIDVPVLVELSCGIFCVGALSPIRLRRRSGVPIAYLLTRLLNQRLRHALGQSGGEQDATGCLRPTRSSTIRPGAFSTVIISFGLKADQLHMPSVCAGTESRPPRHQPEGCTIGRSRHRYPPIVERVLP
jgi:hypothetical protein